MIQGELYLLDGHTQIGPFSSSEVAARITDKSTNSETLAWQEGMSEWRPLQEICPEAFQQRHPIEPRSSPPPPPPYVLKGASYHLLINGKQVGPYTLDEIHTRVANGELSLDERACAIGSDDYQPLRALIPPLKSNPKPTQATSGEGTAVDPHPTSETLANLALVLPLCATLLNVFWIGQMNLLQGPGSALNLLNVIVITGTAILICIEATQLGIGGPYDSRVRKGEKVTGPIGWLLFTLLLWIIGFPAYMYFRSRFGRKNLCMVSILVGVAWLSSVIAIDHAIESRKAQLRSLFSTEHRVRSGTLSYDTNFSAAVAHSHQTSLRLVSPSEASGKSFT